MENKVGGYFKKKAAKDYDWAPQEVQKEQKELKEVGGCKWREKTNKSYLV